MKSWVLSGMLVSAVCALAAQRRADAGVKLAATQIASGLSSPLFVTAPPGDNTRLFIVEQTGTIRIFNLITMTLNPLPFLDIHTKTVGSGEAGLLGMAFHPNYTANGYFYIDYTKADASGKLVERYTVSPNPDLADISSAAPVLFVPYTVRMHNAGWMGFGPFDHFLYISMGDNVNSGKPQILANPDPTNPTANLIGKMLRIDVDHDDFASTNRNYAIPPSNPFANTNGDDEIWAYGLRNPYRNSFDRLTGDFWITDVGEQTYEEVDFELCGDAGGHNYGWACKEGTLCHDSTCCNQPNFTPPIYEYMHDVGCAIIGGYVYRGAAIPDLRGTYFFGDFCSGNIQSFQFQANQLFDLNTNRSSELGNHVSLYCFGEDAEGELYFTDSQGRLFKIVRQCAIAIASDPASQQVCVGADIHLSVTVVGSVGNVTYTWLKDGNTFGAPNAPSITIPANSPADSGVYRCDLQDTCDNVISSKDAVVTVVDPATLSIDCDTNGTIDGCELAGRDCNTNGTIDICEGGCDTNGTPDACELAGHDCNTNGIYDACEGGCNTNAIPDACENTCATAGVADPCVVAEFDCNTDGTLDACDLAQTATNSDSNSTNVLIPAQGTATSIITSTQQASITDVNVQVNIRYPHTNALIIALARLSQTSTIAYLNGSGQNFTNTVFDQQAAISITNGASPFTGTFRPAQSLSRFNSLALAGVWTLSVQSSGSSDTGTLLSWTLATTHLLTADCNTDGIPDACQLAGHDCNTNNALDLCEIDCNTNETPDDCDLLTGQAMDCDTNNTPDACESDCNTNRINDACELSTHDCNTNGIVDSCESSGCNTNGTPDACELAAHDCNTNGTVDECDFALQGSDTLTSSGIVPVRDNATSSSAISSSLQVYATDLNVRVNIRHTATGDLTISLAHLNNTVTLAANLGGPGDNYMNTFFDQQSSVPISFGSAPFSGTFIPQGNLSTFNGAPASGTWTLLVRDSAAGNTGSILSWALVAAHHAFSDCNTDGTLDSCQLGAHDCNTNNSLDLCEAVLFDCNTNKIPDPCELFGRDCNTNSMLDACEIDADHNGIPDTCACDNCPGDINADHRIDSTDIPGWIRCMLGSPQPLDNCTCSAGQTTAQFVSRLLNTPNPSCP